LVGIETFLFYQSVISGKCLRQADIKVETGRYRGIIETFDRRRKNCEANQHGLKVGIILLIWRITMDEFDQSGGRDL
jgi:hypothetical protein